MANLNSRSLTVISSSVFINKNESASDILIGAEGSLIINGGYAERINMSPNSPAQMWGTFGIMEIDSNGSGTSTYIGSGGSQHVINGTVTSTIIEDGGQQRLGDWGLPAGKGSAISTILNGSARQTVESNSYARNTIINSGGEQSVWGAANITTINNGGSQGAYGVVDNTVINSGGYQWVSGSAYRTTVKAGGLQYVGSSPVSETPGYAENVTVEAGGSQTVAGNLKNVTVYGSQWVFRNRNGIFTDVRIMKGGEQSIESSVISGTIIYGSQIVEWGASACSATIKNGGSQIITSAGAAYNTTVEAGGRQENLGVAQFNSISGVQYVYAYHGFWGESYNTKVWKSGKQILDGGVDSGAIVNGSQIINYSGKSYNAAINNGAFQIISSGGSAYNTGLSGIQEVYSGAIISNTKIYIKGEQRIHSGATVRGGLATGRQTVSSGAYASGGVFNKGAVQDVSGIASGALIAGKQIIHKGGNASGGKITSGGSQIIESGGAAQNASVLAGGSQIVNGGAQNTSLSGNQYVGKDGYTTGVKVWKTGKQYINEGGIDSGAITNGSQIISREGRSFNAAINNGAVQIISSGGSANNTGLSGAQYVYAGATVTEAKIYIKGVQYLQKGASITGAKATGRQIISAGATAANGVFNKGASQDVYGTATNIIMAGTQRVYIGGTVNGGSVTSTGILNIDAGTLNLTSSNMSVAGQLILANAKVTGAAGRQVALTNTSLLTIGANNMVSTGINISGAMIINAGNNKLASLTTASTTRTTFDLRNLSASATPLVSLTANGTLNGYAAIQVKTGQNTGTYALASNLARAGSVAITVDGKSAGTVSIGATSSYNGVNYSLANSGNNLTLTLSLAAGRIYTAANSRALDSMTGTEKSDIFLNGQGDDVISGAGGRDVAVYGAEKWGKDTIQATNGSMTLLFKDLKSSDVRQTMSGKDMILSKSGVSGDEIRVKDWNSATHNVVFGGTMGELSRYAAAVSPSENLASAASNEVWRKAGLLA